MSKMKPWLIVLALLLVISASCVRIIQSDGSGINEPTKAVTAIDVSAPTTQKQVPVTTTQKQVPVTTEIAHTTIPGDPGSPEQTSIEIDTSKTASDKTALGDSFRLGNFERPFTESTMEYFQENDLLKLSISKDNNFFYIVIKVAGPSNKTGYPSATYMVEFDTDTDGRGDVLLMAKGNGSQKWTIEGVSVLIDSNNNVGGSQPVLPDGNPGDGYDKVLFSTNVLTDPDSAWQRTNGNSEVQLAIKKDLVPASHFIWKGWADSGLVDPTKFDYNDSFSEEEAGSASKSSKFYPVGKLNLMDSTCGIAYNFAASGKELGGCYQLQPTVAPKAVPVCTSCQQSAACCAQLCPLYTWVPGGCAPP